MRRLMIVVLLVWTAVTFAGQFRQIAKFGGAGAGNGLLRAGLPVVGAAVNADGMRLYVADINADRVQVFNADGTYAFQFGGHGVGAGQFNTPCGIAVSTSAVYVCDFGNRRVQVFDLDGVFVSAFTHPARGTAWYPQQIAVNTTDGNLYVLANFLGQEYDDVEKKLVYKQYNVISVISATGSLIRDIDVDKSEFEVDKKPRSSMLSSLIIAADGTLWAHIGGSAQACQFDVDGTPHTPTMTLASGVAVTPACVALTSGTVFGEQWLTSYQYAGPQTGRVGIDTRSLTSGTVTKLGGDAVPNLACSRMVFDPTQSRLYLIGFDNTIRVLTYVP